MREFTWYWSFSSLEAISVIFSKNNLDLVEGIVYTKFPVSIVLRLVMGSLTNTQTDISTSKYRNPTWIRYHMVFPLSKNKCRIPPVISKWSHFTHQHKLVRSTCSMAGISNPAHVMWIRKIFLDMVWGWVSMLYFGSLIAFVVCHMNDTYKQTEKLV